MAFFGTRMPPAAFCGGEAVTVEAIGTMFGDNVAVEVMVVGIETSVEVKVELVDNISGAR